MEVEFGSYPFGQVNQQHGINVLFVERLARLGQCFTCERERMVHVRAEEIGQRHSIGPKLTTSLRAHPVDREHSICSMGPIIPDVGTPKACCQSTTIITTNNSGEVQDSAKAIAQALAIRYLVDSAP
jgi:hypothetical protein